MSYAAEPYAQFVDDLLTALTGGVAREQFLFVAEQAPFRLAPPGPVVRSSVRVSGQAAGTFTRFRAGRDFVFTADSVIQWKAGADGAPAADAVWPDEGTPFFVNYDHAGPAGAAPRLTDRNPGSVVRLLAESFAREYAVLSRQLESVYEAAFLDTATGRDLDQVVALVGLDRRDRTFAVGTAVFARSSPAPADIFIPAGTKLSTAEPPPVVFETTEERVLRRGELSVEAPIQATVSGAAGVVPAQASIVIHRPILGVESVSKQATELRGADESDDALRARARRALEGAGRATPGALLAALGSLPGVRDKDVRVAEDHLAHPGVVAISAAAPLDTPAAVQAVALIEATRPAGVRVLHNLDAPPPLIAGTPVNLVDDAGVPPAGDAAVEGLYLPVKVRVLLLPASPSLSAAERAALKNAGRDVARAFVQDAGIGEVLVYNRLIARLMAIEGVLDTAVELSPKPKPGLAAGPRHQNLAPGQALRAKLDDADLEVEVAGEIVAFDLTVKIVLTDLGKLGDATANLEDARLQVAGQLQDKVGALAAPITAAKLLGQVVPTDNYTVASLHYTVQYLEAGVRLNAPDPSVQLTELERAWIRTVTLTTDSG